MSDARWLDVADDIASAVKHFRNGALLFEAGGFEGGGIEAYRNQMALMNSLASGYTSLEAAFERILEMVGEAKPTGSDYHAALLRRLRQPFEGHRPALLDDGLWAAVDEARRFRHVARRSYDELDMRRAGPAVGAGVLIAERIGEALAAFRRALETGPDPNGSS